MVGVFTSVLRLTSIVDIHVCTATHFHVEIFKSALLLTFIVDIFAFVLLLTSIVDIFPCVLQLTFVVGIFMSAQMLTSNFKTFNKFHFSDIHRSMNPMGPGSHDNFAQDPLCSYFECQKNEIHLLYLHLYRFCSLFEKFLSKSC